MRQLKGVVIIGAGNMGRAIASGLRRSNPTTPITLVDSAYERNKKTEHDEITLLNSLPSPSLSQVLVIAIPPQAFREFADKHPELANYPDLIISVMAGIKTSELEKRLKTSQICRAIPNLPCAINEGMTVLMCTPTITQENKLLASEIFGGLGRVIVTKQEETIDDATALTGGGPAYVSYFAEALVAYAVSAGFDKSTALSMAIQIIHGTSALLKECQDTPDKLCKKVMTPNGTTVRAIDFLNSKNVRTNIIDALKNSSTRSKELGRGL